MSQLTAPSSPPKLPELSNRSWRIRDRLGLGVA